MSTALPKRKIRLRWLRQVVLPVVLFGLLAAGWLTPMVWQWLDLDPAPMTMMGMWRMNATLLGIILIPLWFLFLSGYRWRTRLAVLGIAAMLIASGAACVAEWDVTGNVVPYPRRYRWEKKPQELLAESRRAAEAEGKTLPPIDIQAKPGDSFPRYRGAKFDGAVDGVTLSSDWADHPPRILWNQPVGEGFAGFAVAGNMAITVEQRGNEETIVCYDRATGRERWKFAYEADFKHATGDGPRATPTLADDSVYSVGATGELVCLDAKTGKKKWQHNILEDSKAKNVIWALTCSPLIADDLVIVNPGIDPGDNQKMAIAAYRRSDGKRMWATGEHPAGYSSPQRATLAGVDQGLLFDGGGLVGFDLKTGKELWRHPWSTFNDMNIIQPLVLPGDRVFLSSEASNGCAMLKINKKGKEFEVEPLWANTKLGSRFANPVERDGFIYGLGAGYLLCLDSTTGERKWRGKRYDNGQLLRVGKNLLVQSEGGEIALVGADPQAFQERGRFKVFKNKTWNTPALAGKQLFMRNAFEMACVELPLDK
jgi:outer membrane protein assembly factor BamB